MRDALSQVLWAASVTVFIAAALGLLAVLHLGRQSGQADAGPLLASLTLWAQMTSLGLVGVLVLSTATAIGCLIWLDLWRAYQGDTRCRTTARDRRMSLRHASDVFAALGRWRYLQRAASVAAGHKPLPFWGWCLLGLAEGARQLGRLGRRAARRTGAGLYGLLQVLVVLTWLAGKGLARTARWIGKQAAHLARRLKPRLIAAARATARGSRIAGLQTQRQLRRWTPRLAAALGELGILAWRGAEYLGRKTGKALVWLVASAVSAAISAFWVAVRLLSVSARALTHGWGQLRHDVARRRAYRAQPAYATAGTRFEAAGQADPPPKPAPTGDQAVCPCCGRSKPMPPPGSYVCGQCGATFVVTAEGVRLQGTCPGCGRQRLVDRAGRFQCGHCKLTFSVTPTGSVVDATCPGCGKFRPVDRLGRFACSACKMEFDVTAEGVRVEATCPICRRSKQVPHLGRFQCSQCETVFRVEAAATVVEATCPSCSHVQDVPEAGIYRCQACQTVFTVAPAGTTRPGATADRRDGRRVLDQFMETEKLRHDQAAPAADPGVSA